MASWPVRYVASLDAPLASPAMESAIDRMAPTPAPRLLLAVLAGAATALGALALAGCAPSSYADRGALLGGAGGAGVGALVGHATGHTGAGAAIGAGVGALSGALIGNGLDEIDARNRAAIEAQLRRPLAPGAVTLEDVVAMTRAGVAEDLMINHIRANGVARPLQASDLIYLQQQAVSPNVIRAMQEWAVPPAPARAVPVPRPLIIEEHYHRHPYWYPPPRCYSW